MQNNDDDDDVITFIASTTHWVDSKCIRLTSVVSVICRVQRELGMARQLLCSGTVQHKRH